MTARTLFLDTMRERRTHNRGTLSWQYLTRAARKYVWLMREIPTKEWPQ